MILFKIYKENGKSPWDSKGGYPENRPMIELMDGRKIKAVFFAPSEIDALLWREIAIEEGIMGNEDPFIIKKFEIAEDPGENLCFAFQNKDPHFPPQVRVSCEEKIIFKEIKNENYKNDQP